MKSKPILQTIEKTLVYLFVALILIITLFPFFWVLRTSLTPAKEVFADVSRLWPKHPTIMNYVRILGLVDVQTAVAMGGTGQKVNFLVNLKNTLLVSGIMTFVQVMFSAMAAYAFARLRFPGRDKIFAVILSAMMIPNVVLMIPNFVMIKQLGWLNTYQGIMAPSLLMTPYTVFFLRQFFLGINKELEEAAYIDGAGMYQTFFTIILPITQTALVTIAVTTFINAWNDYMWPLIVAKKDNMRTLTVALGVFRSQTPQGQPDWSGLMAGTVLAIIPALLIFSVFSKKIINSIKFSGFR